MAGMKFLQPVSMVNLHRIPSQDYRLVDFMDIGWQVSSRRRMKLMAVQTLDQKHPGISGMKTPTRMVCSLVTTASTWAAQYQSSPIVLPGVSIGVDLTSM